MAAYRIHRLKDHLRQGFRFAPHVSGTANVKPRDYEAGATVEAESPYAAFFALREVGTPLEVGDLLETESGALRIFKYVGFEEAQWVVPEAKPEGSPDQTSGSIEEQGPGDCKAASVIGSPA